MATYRKTATGGTRAEVYVSGLRKSKVFTTKQEAKNWAAQTEYELSQLAVGASSTHTLGDIFIRYSHEISSNKKGSRWEKVRLLAFENYPIAKVLLSDLRREHFDEWVALRLKKVKPSTVNRELNLISSCLTEARRWRLMTGNPMQDLKRPKNPPHRDRRVFDHEIAAFCIACMYREDRPVLQHQQRTAVAFLFAIETAMRAGEICALMPGDVNFKAKTASVRDSKNGFGRDVPLSKRAVELLKKLEPWEDGKPIFRLRADVLSSLAYRAISAAGINNLTFHDTRHEATTRLAGKMDVLDLARTTGHRDIKQLLVYYNKSAADIAKLLD